MYFTADLHMHSHYAKATSPYLNLDTMYQWARIKGVDVIGTGDFTHPAWFAELKERLKPEGSGFFTLKDPPAALPHDIKVSAAEPRFCLTTEISCETIHKGKPRRVHNLVYAPDFATVQALINRLSPIANLAEDGRPTLPISSKELLEIILETSPDAHFIPAHIWTPWFSLLGSAYGYDGVEECFEDLTPHLFALETSLSADPLMCGRLSELDRYTLISNSDAHSAENIGREVNRFDTDMDYYAMFRAIKTRQGFLGTYEYVPSLGKYYHDGHRDCKRGFDPARSRQINGICPECGRSLTLGTLSRTEKLADREKALSIQDFNYIIPLPELLSEIHGVSKSSKKITHEFSKAISVFGKEFDLLHKLPIEDIRKKDPILSIAIERLRAGTFECEPGYDGHHGRLRFFKSGELDQLKRPQLSLF